MKISLKVTINCATYFGWHDALTDFISVIPLDKPSKVLIPTIAKTETKPESLSNDKNKADWKSICPAKISLDGK